MTNHSKKILWIFIVVFSFFCCSCAHYQQYQQKQQAYAKESYRLAPFSAIVITGYTNVKLSQSNITAISFAGQKQYVDSLSAKVINNILYIDASAFSPIDIKLQTANVLRSITIAGHTYLSANNIAVKKLNLSASNESSITLNGKFNIANITQNGTGKIEIKWLDSNNIKIVDNGRGPIYLAGTVNNLTAVLTNHSFLDARYLRSQKATILATDHATANVLATNTLDIFADHGSNVLYYKRPLELNKVTKSSGNALLMEELR